MGRKRYEEYAPLAWFYDRYWGAQYHRLVLPILERLLLCSLPSGSSILDVCCGTGHLARELISRGYRVTGIDGSEEMLVYARKRAPQGEFLAADARDFTLPGSFRAAVSTFESLNHILLGNELLEVFQNVRAVLVGGGSFFFDLLTEEAYTTLWQKSSATVEDDNVCILRGGYDGKERLGKSEITLFRLEGTWKRTDLRLFQRCHEPTEVRSALERAGFTEISLYDARADLGMAGDMAVGRVFFTAVK